MVPELLEIQLIEPIYIDHMRNNKISWKYKLWRSLIRFNQISPSLTNILPKIWSFDQSKWGIISKSIKFPSCFTAHASKLVLSPMRYCKIKQLMQHLVNFGCRKSLTSNLGKWDIFGRVLALVNIRYTYFCV